MIVSGFWFRVKMAVQSSNSIQYRVCISSDLQLDKNTVVPDF